MNRSPWAFRRRAPSPRQASETRAPLGRAVGWNWTNSRSRSTAPARQARAIPSPVAPWGFVVTGKRRPNPPVARRTAPARTSQSPPGPQRRAPATRFPETRRLRAWAGTTGVESRLRSPSRRRSPLRSPPRWKTLARECPPSRVGSGWKGRPKARSLSRWRGASSRMERATPSSTRPRPATRVSRRWASRSSSPTGKATPPWAQGVEPAGRGSLLTRRTRAPRSSAAKAA